LVGLFIGCGSGSGEGGACMGGSNGATCNDGAESEEGGSSGETNDNEAEDSLSPVNSTLDYLSVENNVTKDMGMFFIARPNDQAMAHINDYTTTYGKEIIYHNVDNKTAIKLHALMDGIIYQEGYCSYRGMEGKFTFCQDYYLLDTLPQYISSAHIIFNQLETKGCATENGLCDITLIVRANPSYYNNTNPIPLSLFKDIFISTPNNYLGANMANALSKIEQNATTVSATSYNWYTNRNISIYNDVNFTLQAYTSGLKVNGEYYANWPQIPVKENGEGVELFQYKGTNYQLENFFDPFESVKVDYDVNETDTNGKYYWMANKSKPHEDNFNWITLCQRTANETSTTNATYTCEEGKGNITAHWSLQGKNIHLGW